MKNLPLLSLILALTAHITIAAAPVYTNKGITYQGALCNASGQPLAAGPCSIEFRLYNDPIDNNPLWGRTISVLLSETGTFSCELSDSKGSSITGLTKTLDRVIAEQAEGTLYVGLTVANSSGEIRPRQKILPVPTALFAQDVARASGNFHVQGTATIATVSANNTTTQALTVQGNSHVEGDLSVGGGITGNGTIPIGGIILWSGNVVPTGWALCNGQTSEGRKTPDLRDRFVVGAGGAYKIDNIGGTNAVTLTISQMPSHSHSTSFKYMGYVSERKEYDECLSSRDNGVYKGWESHSTSYAGGSLPHENRPPYYALAYIMRVK